MTTRFSRFFQIAHCFNVAAITALAVWNAYAFYVSHHPIPNLQLISNETPSNGKCCAYRMRPQFEDVK